jgi:hypothetical protein
MATRNRTGHGRRVTGDRFHRGFIAATSVVHRVPLVTRDARRWPPEPPHPVSSFFSSLGNPVGALRDDLPGTRLNHPDLVQAGAEKRIEPRVRTRATDAGHQRAEEHIDPALKSRMNYATSVKPLA